MYYYLRTDDSVPDSPKVICVGTGRAGWRVEVKDNNKVLGLSKKPDGTFLVTSYSYDVLRAFYKKVSKGAAKAEEPDLVSRSERLWDENIKTIALGGQNGNNQRT